MTIGEKAGGIVMQIVAFRTEVVVYHVQQDHKPMRMRILYQRLEFFGSTVAAVGREWQRAVVTPVTRPGKVPERHQLDGGDTQPGQLSELLPHRGEGTLGCVAADVQLIDDRLLPWSAAPVGVGPVECPWIDNLARPMHVVRLVARGGIGHPCPVLQAIQVATARTRLLRQTGKPATRLPRQGQPPESV